MAEKTYVLITPAHNEADNIEKTIQSVVAQTILPLKWVIVSDGSTDRTDEIVSYYAEKYPFIKPLRREADGERNFCSKVFAIQLGLQSLAGITFDFIGNLDADVSFEPAYFQKLLDEFEKNSNLGIGGGTIHEARNGRLQTRPGNRSRSVPGALQLFRRKCFAQIGGFVPLEHGGEDTVMEIKARMSGWEVRSFFHLIAHHHRLNGNTGLTAVCFREGVRGYHLGNHPVYEFSRFIRRLGYRPRVLGSLSRLAGYCWSLLRREKRHVPLEVIRFLRNEQIIRLSQHVWPFQRHNH